MKLWLAIVLAGAAALAAVPAGAQEPPKPGVPIFGQFHSVLAQGEGDSVNAVALATYLATGAPPARFVDQQPLYVGRHAAAAAARRARRSATSTRTPTSGRCPAASAP